MSLPDVRVMFCRIWGAPEECKCGEQVKRSLLFVNKKKQKNFAMLGHGRCPDNAHGPA
jgi:hypothetical protein